MPLVTYQPLPAGDDERSRRREHMIEALEQYDEQTVVLCDLKGRRWMKQARPYAVPFLANWRCTSDPQDPLWATSRQLAEVLGY